MKKLLLIIIIIVTQNIYSQAHIGVMGGYDLDMENSQIGVGLNYGYVKRKISFWKGLTCCRNYEYGNA